MVISGFITGWAVSYSRETFGEIIVAWSVDECGGFTHHELCL